METEDVLSKHVLENDTLLLATLCDGSRRILGCSQGVEAGDHTAHGRHLLVRRWLDLLGENLASTTDRLNGQLSYFCLNFFTLILLKS